LRRADHSSRGVLPSVLIKLRGLPYEVAKDCRANDNDDDDDDKSLTCGAYVIIGTREDYYGVPSIMKHLYSFIYVCERAYMNI
jgi:hypothetical protein